MSSISPLGTGGVKPGGKSELKALAREVVQTGLRKEKVSIPNTSNAFKKLDEFLNMGSTRDLSLDDLSPGEKEEFFKMLSILLQNHIVGYHVYEVDGRPEKHYAVNEIGDRRLYGRRLWDEKRDRKI